MFFKRNSKAFTLIELLVVIGIIGILSASVFVLANSSRKRSRDAQRKTDLQAVAAALSSYYADKHSYPATIYSNTDFQPYLKNTPKDPKDGSEYYYQNCNMTGTPAACTNGTQGQQYTLSDDLESKVGSKCIMKTGEISSC